MPLGFSFDVVFFKFSTDIKKNYKFCRRALIIVLISDLGTRIVLIFEIHLQSSHARDYNNV